jgi:hypothetical protein
MGNIRAKQIAGGANANGGSIVAVSIGGNVRSENEGIIKAAKIGGSATAVEGGSIEAGLINGDATTDESGSIIAGEVLGNISGNVILKDGFQPDLSELPIEFLD